MFPLVLECPGDSAARCTSSSQEARLSVVGRSGDRGCLTDEALLCNFPVMGSYKFFVGEGRHLWGSHSSLPGWQGLECHVVSASSLPESFPDTLCRDVFPVSGNLPPYKVVAHSFFPSLGLI